MAARVLTKMEKLFHTSGNKQAVLKLILNNLMHKLLSFDVPESAADSKLTFKLTVVDDKDASDSDEVTVEVESVVNNELNKLTRQTDKLKPTLTPTNKLKPETNKLTLTPTNKLKLTLTPINKLKPTLTLTPTNKLKLNR